VNHYNSTADENNTGDLPQNAFLENATPKEGIITSHNIVPATHCTILHTDVLNYEPCSNNPWGYP